jgi:hypothetical protein
MRPDARLDAVVFQLTPTWTRSDLVLIANGRKEKLASGLLKPFLEHLKAAQDQIAKGGYSITLEPSSGFDVPWFTRGTVERFVRFVSTPEVLERVTTLESEILQLEDAIGIVCLFACVCAFSLRRESPDMILGDKPLISEMVLSQLVSEQDCGKTHTKASKNHKNAFGEERLAHIRTLVVSLGGKLTFVLIYATTDLHQRRYVVIFGVFILFYC